MHIKMEVYKKKIHSNEICKKLNQKKLKFRKHSIFQKTIQIYHL